MKKTLLSIIFLLFVLSVNSQIDTTETKIKKYLAWVSPSDATHIYGLMFNIWPRDAFEEYETYPKIYGAELNLNPVGIIFPFFYAIHLISPDHYKPPSEKIETLDFDSFKKIYGIQIGLLNIEKSIINGLDINAAGSLDSKTNGLTISAVMNKHYIMNGLTVAPFGNHDLKCKGVQIGLINSCKDLKGLQLGLWNKNQKRSLPIINWCFQ